MNSNKKVLITDSYSLNTGDIGILFSMIDSFKYNIPNIEIFVESSHPNYISNFKELKGIKIIHRNFDIQNIINCSSSLLLIKYVIFGIYDAITFLIWSIFKRYKMNINFIIRKSKKENIEILNQIDFIISSGGGFLSSYYNYFFRLYIYLIAIILKKDIILFAQSVGPFNSFLSKKLIPIFLNKCKFITIREPDSYNYLKKFNIKTKVYLTSDIAFLLEENKELNKIKNKTVSICIKNNNDKNDKFYKIILNIIDYLFNNGYLVNIISHTINDDELAKKFKNYNKKIQIYLFGENPRNIKSIYKYSDFIIACRMHAIVFASEVSTPFLSISYEPKFNGLISQLKYDNYLQLKYKKLDKDDIINRINYLINSQKIIINNLNIINKKIKMKSYLNIELLLNYINNK